ncbi:hypothetical protein COV19_03455 [Candidatus Woesearchaeota archaeon CG10_big_fil_rev_8_21_14_0_10_44_13]|nr:MAG: hypothetical protein COV19_03455 [Candidatus Woesearchaeota archaeon CG10_big_fil_rev_8_21_14_0_10_44_13]
MKKIVKEFKGYVTGIWDFELIIGQMKEVNVMDFRNRDRFKEIEDSCVTTWICSAFDEIYEVKDMKQPKKAHIRVTIERLD